MLTITVLRDLKDKFYKLVEAENIEIVGELEIFGGTSFKVESKETYKLYTFVRNFNNFQLNHLYSKGEIKGEDTSTYLLFILCYGYLYRIPEKELENICIPLKRIFGETVYHRIGDSCFDVIIDIKQIEEDYNFWWIY